MPEPTPVSALFDELADDYDQSGVDFFGPIADLLIGALTVEPGSTVADLGTGRGAVALRLAELVAPDGRVTALDLAPRMIERLAGDAARAGLDGVITPLVGDAADPQLEAASFDLVTSSAVLFFLPDPETAVRRWLALLRPGGALAISTFGPVDEVWQAIDDLLVGYLPAAMRDPRRPDPATDPFATDASLSALVERAYGRAVVSESHQLPVRFHDVDHFHRWSMSTGMRAMWRAVPGDQLEGVRRRVDGLLRHAGAEDGSILLQQTVRITTATT